MSHEHETHPANDLRLAATVAGSRARAAMRQSLQIASEIARTEEAVASTFERMASTRPADAERLRALAAEARRFAEAERASVSAANG
jgi:hypothetical protein